MKTIEQLEFELAAMTKLWEDSQEKLLRKRGIKNQFEKVADYVKPNWREVPLPSMAGWVISELKTWRRPP